MDVQLQRGLPEQIRKARPQDEPLQLTSRLCQSDQSAQANTPGVIRFATGTIIRMPHQLGFPRASAIAIQTIIMKMILTTGIKNRTIYQTGFLATFNISTMLAIGIQASQESSVLVLSAMV